MKRLLVASIVLVAFGSALVFGQTQQSAYGQGGGYDPGMTQGGGYGYGYGVGPGMMQGGMGPGMMRGGPGFGRGFMHGHGGGPCMGCMVACASMVMPQLAPTSDGGVVVAISGKLVKYNSTLHKVGEVNIEIDWTEVQQRVEQIVQNCPMHRRFLQQYGQVPTPPQAPFPGQAQGTPPAPAPGTFQGQQPR